MDDLDGNLIFNVDSTLTPHKKEDLWTAILAWSAAGLKDIELLDRDTSGLKQEPTFTVLHFSFYARYAPDVRTEFFLLKSG